MTDTYNKIRAIRNKLIPPKLEFGCLVIGDNLGRIYKIIEKGKGKGNVGKYWCFLDQYTYLLQLENCKILGGPLTTNDILLMLNKDNIEVSLDLDLNWADRTLVIFQKETKIEIWIDLTKSIENQTEDTLLAILSLVE